LLLEATLLVAASGSAASRRATLAPVAMASA